jgi:hypothetical protein
MEAPEGEMMMEANLAGVGCGFGDAEPPPQAAKNATAMNGTKSRIAQWNNFRVMRSLSK